MVVKTKTEVTKQIDIPELTNYFPNLIFNEEKHSYTVNGKSLTSVTTYLKRFYKQFPSYHMATVMEDKNKDKEAIGGLKRDRFYFLRRWKMQSDEASTAGTRVHEYAQYNYPHFADKPVCSQETAVKNFFTSLDSKYIVLAQELRVYDLDYLIAGTIDCILFNTETGNLVIVDWKTNTRNVLQVYNGEKLSEPFSTLLASSLNKYAIQLSLYKLILEKTIESVKVEDLWIVHLSDEDWTQLDYSKRDQQHKYVIDNVTPNLIENGYRVYYLQDHSSALKQYLDDNINRKSSRQVQTFDPTSN